MTGLERREAIDEHRAAVTNLIAGLLQDGGVAPPDTVDPRERPPSPPTPPADPA